MLYFFSIVLLPFALIATTQPQGPKGGLWFPPDSHAVAETHTPGNLWYPPTTPGYSSPFSPQQHTASSGTPQYPSVANPFSHQLYGNPSSSHLPPDVTYVDIRGTRYFYPTAPLHNNQSNPYPAQPSENVAALLPHHHLHLGIGEASQHERASSSFISAPVVAHYQYTRTAAAVTAFAAPNHQQPPQITARAPQLSHSRGITTTTQNQHTFPKHLPPRVVAVPESVIIAPRSVTLPNVPFPSSISDGATVSNHGQPPRTTGSAAMAASANPQQFSQAGENAAAVVASTSQQPPQTEERALIIEAFLKSSPLMTHGQNLPFMYQGKVQMLPTIKMLQSRLINEALTLFWNECKDYVRENINKTGQQSDLAKSFCINVDKALFSEYTKWHDFWDSLVIRNLENNNIASKEIDVITSLISGTHIPRIIRTYLSRVTQDFVAETQEINYTLCTQPCFKPTENLVAKLTELLHTFGLEKQYSIKYTGHACYDENDDDRALEYWASYMLPYQEGFRSYQNTQKPMDDEDEIVWKGENFF